MKTNLLACVVVLASACFSSATNVAAEDAKLTLAAGGTTDYVITLAGDGSKQEDHAAKELAQFLKQATGAAFPIMTPEQRGGRPTIAVGAAAAKAIDPKLDFTGLGQEGVVVQTEGKNLILTGAPGALRGTLYAVYTFLEDSVGCRWWSATESTIPHRGTLAISTLKYRHVPPFEYREPYVFEAFNPDWAVHNKCNGQAYRLDAVRGGSIVYRGGFVHTSNPLVPPKKFFPTHPEWFSEINGRRVAPPANCQWCLSNPELLAYCIGRVKSLLHDAPPDSIVSISQNDWDAHCHCAKCMEIEKAEGSAAGPLLRFVNAVADAIKDEYPRAAIDTLAYQYTRKPPLLTRPRPNVIIRLCSIECSFAQPLDTPRNKKFAADMEGWQAICQRIYVWDYITNFSHYMLPFPNLRVLGPNIRFYAKHGVRGIFEEGCTNTNGSEFGVLRAWVLAKLLWNPEADDRALIREFIDGYYGAAAPHVMAYLDMLHDAIEKMDCALPIFGSPAPRYLTLDVLSQGESLFEKAEKAVAGQPDLLRRVRLAHASVQYAALRGWFKLRQTAVAENRPWPFGDSPRNLLKRFCKTCEESHVTKLSEGAHQTPVEEFRGLFEVTGPHPGVATPDSCKHMKDSDWADCQETQFRLASPGVWCEKRKDPAASNGLAVWMPGSHVEWAVQLEVPPGLWLDRADAKWTAYAVVRVDKKTDVKSDGKGNAFQCGIYDAAEKKGCGGRTVKLAEIKDNAYHAYRIGSTSATASRYIWFAPCGNKDKVGGVWIDRVFFVREP